MIKSYFDQGQEDAATGRQLDEPHKGAPDDLLKNAEQNAIDNAQYRLGYINTQAQQDAAENKREPPHGLFERLLGGKRAEEENAAYYEAWDAARKAM